MTKESPPIPLKNNTLKIEANKVRATQIIGTIKRFELPSRVVDIVTNKIIICNDWKFWTISYVWQKCDEWSIGERPYPVNNLEWKVNAFTKEEWEKTRKILYDNNIKKVWIDSLCIDQKSILEKQQEISKMANIYKLSEGCIIFPNGLGNTTNKTEFMSKQSKWFSRVWTVQEGILPKNLKIYFDTDKFIDIREEYKKNPNNDNEFQKILGLDDLAPYDLLRMTSQRESSLIEDKIYSLIGILGLKEIKLEYGIGPRNAAIKVFQSMSIDQRAQWVCVDWISGNYPDGMCCVPVLTSNYHGHKINITSNITIRTVLALADFNGHNGTLITGKWFEAEVDSNFNINEKILEPKEIILHNCEKKCKEKYNKQCDRKCYGICEYTGKIIAIIIGTTEESEKGKKILLLCRNIGSVLHKVGLAETNNYFNTIEGRWNIS